MTSYAFTTLDDPSATAGTFPQGINDAGEIVGYYPSGATSIAFVYNNGSYKNYTPQNIKSANLLSTQSATTAEGVNNSGQIVGSGFYALYSVSGSFPSGPPVINQPTPGVETTLALSANDAYSGNADGSAWTPIQAPINGAVITGKPSFVKTFGEGINSAGSVAGYYTDLGGNHGFLDINGTIQEFNYPGIGGATFAHGVNDLNQVVGYFIGTDPNQPNNSTAHGFFYNNGAFSFFDDPNAVNGTFAEGINNLDQIAGYYVDGNGFSHGFIFNKPTGTYTTVDVSGASNTFIYGINNNGQVVGDYVDGSGHTHGFVAAPAFPQVVGTGDFAHDGTSDAVVQNPDGTIAIWELNGSQVVSSTNVGAMPSNWHFGLVGDVNGDGKTDILWQSDSGGIVVWEMNGTQVTVNQFLGQIPSNWHPAATGDFNGDGKSDVLLHSDGGGVVVWTMNGAQVVGDTLVGQIPSNWHVGVTGDFNGDGKVDVMLHSDAGGVVLWTMNGAHVVGDQLIGQVPSNWQMAGAGDFNGDGNSDVLWVSNAGTVVVWLMNGTSVIADKFLGSEPAGYQFAGIGDFDGNHTSDIMWKNASGNELIWNMNGTQVVSSTPVTGAATSAALDGSNASAAVANAAPLNAGDEAGQQVAHADQMPQGMAGTTLAGGLPNPFDHPDLTHAAWAHPNWIG